jgi:hypothetical protein
MSRSMTALRRLRGPDAITEYSSVRSGKGRRA